ncbi:MAG: DUF484 family protein [Methylotenera sp.]|uniref:DUF484 family protein n=1 Tax=Methylotenera sp. TaxID=2051956 RepID=UPI00185DEF61|nr:DUF484 family protein [Methylotenera sp.]NOU25778.1 DUF484 family protein [Methylotenera sp.]
MQQDNQIQNDAISADEVSSYLRSHPHFFEQYANLLTEIFLPSPHGSGAISLAERQQLAQRDKIRVQEVMLAQIIEFGEQNDVTSHKVHNLSVKLLENHSLTDLEPLIAESMQQVFAVKQAQIHLWLKPSDETLSYNAIFSPVSNAFSDWVTALEAPNCGTKPESAQGLLDENLQSFAFIPLHKNDDKKQAIGVLILGSEDPLRFKADMGLMYLKRIGDLVSASFSRYL